MKKDAKKQKKNAPVIKKVNIPLQVIKNIVLVAVFGLLVHQVIKSNAGYDWIYNTMLKNNMKMVKEYPDLTLDEKYEIKVGFSFLYLNFIKNQTPEDAVILLPSKEDFFPKEGKSQFTNEPYNKLWSTRFLHPRKLILHEELDKSPYASKITHVAIANNKGYEYLNYPVRDSITHGVLPIQINQ